MRRGVLTSSVSLGCARAASLVPSTAKAAAVPRPALSDLPKAPTPTEAAAHQVSPQVFARGDFDPSEYLRSKADIERRRLAPSAVETEFGGGQTERLRAEVGPRAVAAHRLHYTDTVVREVYGAAEVRHEDMTEAEHGVLTQWRAMLRGQAATTVHAVEAAACAALPGMTAAVWVAHGEPTTPLDREALATATPAVVSDAALVTEWGAGQPRDEGWCFVLWLENHSAAEAVNHIAARFGVKPASIKRKTTLPKQACVAQLCFATGIPAAALLSLNTMRFPGFVLRTSHLRRCGVEEWRALPQPQVRTTTLLRRVQRSSKVLEEELGDLVSRPYVNYYNSPPEQHVLVFRNAAVGRFRPALQAALAHHNMQRSLRAFIREPTKETAVEARRTAGNLSNRTMLKAFARTGSFMAALFAAPHRAPWYHAAVHLAWNTMASQRLRAHGPQAVVGDLAVRKELRGLLSPSHRLTEDDVEPLLTEEDAALCPPQFVVLPVPNRACGEHHYPTCEGATCAAYMRTMTDLGVEAIITVGDDTLADEQTRRLRRLLEFALPAVVYRPLFTQPASPSWRVTLDNAQGAEAAPQDARRILWHDRLLLQRQHDAAADYDAAAMEPDEEHPRAEASSSSLVTTGAASMGTPPMEMAAFTSAVPAVAAVSAPTPVVPTDRYVVRALEDGAYVETAPLAPDAEEVHTVCSVVLSAVLPDAHIVGMLRETFALEGVTTHTTHALQHHVHHFVVDRDAEHTTNHVAPYCFACGALDHVTLRECSVQAARDAARHSRRAERRLAEADQASSPRATVPAPLPQPNGTVDATAIRDATTSPWGFVLGPRLELVAVREGSPAEVALRPHGVCTGPTEDGRVQCGTGFRVVSANGVPVGTLAQFVAVAAGTEIAIRAKQLS